MDNSNLTPDRNPRQEHMTEIEALEMQVRVLNKQRPAVEGELRALFYEFADEPLTAERMETLRQIRRNLVAMDAEGYRDLIAILDEILDRSPSRTRFSGQDRSLLSRMGVVL